MAKKMLIDATHPEETRVVVVDGNKVEDFDYESINKRQLAGNIYLAKVTRVEPSLQAAFVDYGGNRHGFLAFAEIHPDYYQIPVADREALLAEEAREDEERRAREDEEAEQPSKTRRRRRSRSRDKTEADDDAVKDERSKTDEVETGAATAGAVVAGLEVIDVLEADQVDAPRGLEIAEPDLDPNTDTAQQADEVGDNAAVSDNATEAKSAEVTEDPVDAEALGEEDAASPEEPEESSASETDEPPAPEADAETDDTGNDSPEDEPKTIAESAGLDDENDQVSEEIPSLTKAAKSGEPMETAEVSSEPAAADTPDAEASQPDITSAAEEPSEAQVSTDTETVGADVVSDGTASEAASDSTPNGADADTPEGANTSTDDAANAEKSADGNNVDDADATVPDSDDTEDEGRQKRSRRRRRRVGKKSEAKSKDQDTDGNDATSDETKGENGDTRDDDEDVEDVGADDTLEEAANARVRLRRKYKIQDVIKVRQILLVQVVKEERGNKGAALTTYLSLAGRYCVLMPNTARGGGISRKITNAGDRKRLREITGELEVPKGMGLIVRTAGAERTRAEIKRDYEFLTRQWEQIRELTLKSIAPTLIYEEGSLIKRSIRDIYSKEIDQILVEGETGYREAKEYMKMLMPSHAKNVQPYTDPIPLLTRYQVESYLNGMFNPTVQLKSGGYIVIGVTEALVAIDVNSGRATKQGSIEETATQTNLEACDEVARQLRLRDLAGLIVIDFIDMDENRNNRAVEKRMKDRLKNDRARIQVGRISAFGLMEMSRQRLRPGMLEATTQPCPHCHGVGLIRSDDSLSLSILREVEEEGVRNRANEITVRAPVEIANYIINAKREHVSQIEERHGISVLVMGDPSLISPNFEIDRAKTQTRRPAKKTTVISAESAVTEAEIIEEDAELEADAETDTRDGESKSKRRRGRRGGRRKKNAATNGDAGADVAQTESEAGPSEGAEAEDGTSDTGREKRSRRGGRGRRSRDKSDASTETADATEATPDIAEAAPDKAAANVEGDAETPSADSDSSADNKSEPPENAVSDAAPEESGAETDLEPSENLGSESVTVDPTVETEAIEEPAATEPAEMVVTAEAAPEPPGEDTPPKPKRRGWWSLGS